MSIEVKGLEALMAKLESLGGDVDKAMKKGTLSAAGRVKSSAKMRCPADTGDLRASIHSEYKRDGDTHIGIVSTNKEYAPHVEFGTGPTGNGTYPYPVDVLQYKADKWRVSFIDKDGKLIHCWTAGQKAQPFMYPALLENRENIIASYERALTNEIIKTVKK